MKLVLTVLFVLLTGCTKQVDTTVMMKAEITRLSKENVSLKKTVTRQSAHILKQRREISELQEELDGTSSCDTVEDPPEPPASSAPETTNQSHYYEKIT